MVNWGEIIFLVADQLPSKGFKNSPQKNLPKSMMNVNSSFISALNPNHVGMIVWSHLLLENLAKFCLRIKIICLFNWLKDLHMSRLWRGLSWDKVRIYIIRGLSDKIVTVTKKSIIGKAVRWDTNWTQKFISRYWKYISSWKNFSNLDLTDHYQHKDCIMLSFAYKSMFL